MSTRDGVATPRMRAQLRLLAVLAGFVVLIVAVAFVAAFRNTATDRASSTPTQVRIEPPPPDDRNWYVLPNVRGGAREAEDLFVVRLDGRVHALRARSDHLACQVVVRPTRELLADPDEPFESPCDGATFTVDGRCATGPCGRGLAEFRVIERSGALYVDLAHLQRGETR
jgi:nitrite reductase/ring-hydroxylating ferredoxin subunit